MHVYRLMLSGKEWMYMQTMPMSKRAYRTAHRTVTIAIDIGQYHFIDWEGWHLEWNTRTPREWWQKRQWEREGGWSQDENTNHNRHSGGE
jgi:hypothetical protein